MGIENSKAERGRERISISNFTYTLYRCSHSSNSCSFPRFIFSASLSRRRNSFGGGDGNRDGATGLHPCREGQPKSERKEMLTDEAYRRRNIEGPFDAEGRHEHIAQPESKMQRAEKRDSTRKNGCFVS